MHRLARVYPYRSRAGCRARSFATSHSRHSAIIHTEHAQSLNESTNALVSFPTKNHNPNPHGPLSNLTVAIKDNICTIHLPTTCSSGMLRHFTSPFDATAVELLKAGGASIIGKANCDEFGMGSLNVNSIHGPVVNPYHSPNEKSIPWAERERRSAGGSSGGSAAAVAAGMCDAALGTDTGGSIRLPASYCGITGLKPSYGLISRWGVVSFADSLDCVGVLGKSVDTVKTVFESISSYDPKDPTAATPHTRERAKASAESLLSTLDADLSDPDLSSLRIGIPQEYFPSELNTTIVTAVRKVLERLSSLGAQLIPVSLPSTPYALSAYYVIASAEASSNLARYDGVQYGTRFPLLPGADKSKPGNVYAHTRSAGFGAEVQKRILLGTYALTADAFDNYFLQAQRVRQRIKTDFDSAFRIPNAQLSNPSPNPDGVDVILHPSAIRTAPRLDSDAVSGLGPYLQDVMAVPASLAGLPTVSVPAGLAADGWPIGVSVVGQWGSDELVMCIGKVIERTSDEDDGPMADAIFGFDDVICGLDAAT
ncbi:amidase signature domain-containing protein [Suillus placidus]|uniref:Glutamyl-tRNA(Gln) amidotransferase subunit A, mitochondrial n=1 Tax=Suillus placidus TaxID=48579 RepID=A0A9P6ZQK3_9AGAM|nr:amidase signature domain-containing protein [Suillus placidus]